MRIQALAGHRRGSRLPACGQPRRSGRDRVSESVKGIRLRVAVKKAMKCSPKTLTRTLERTPNRSAYPDTLTRPHLHDPLRCPESTALRPVDRTSRTSAFGERLPPWGRRQPVAAAVSAAPLPVGAEFVRIPALAGHRRQGRLPPDRTELSPIPCLPAGTARQPRSSKRVGEGCPVKCGG